MSPLVLVGVFLAMGHRFPFGLRKTDKASKAGLQPGNQVTESGKIQSNIFSVGVTLAWTAPGATAAWQLLYPW